MPLTIGANISSLRTQRLLQETTSNLSTTYERLSSGMRITRASDDAAGLAIADGLRVDARVYSQGVRNLNDGISMLNIAGGALGQLSVISQRQLELAQQAANGSYSLAQRKALNSEAKVLEKEFNRIVETTSFNGLGLLDGSLIQGLRMQAGYGSGIGIRLGSELARSVGSGTFSTSFTATSSGFVTQAEFVDVNGDGVLDMLSAGQSQGLRVALGNGDGTFQAHSTYFSPVAVDRISIGDFNGDGIRDVAAIRAESGALQGAISIFLGNSNGSFGAPVSYASGGAFRPGQIKVADLNRDGRDDLVVSDFTNGTMRVLSGDGNGSFGAVVSYSTGGVQPTNFEISDLNNDGFLDIVSKSFGGFTQPLNILLGNSDGSFKAAVQYGDRGGEGTLVIRDFNDDGKLDAITSDYSSGIIYLSLGNGDGSFGAMATVFGIGVSAINVQVMAQDLNDDGILDLISSNYATGVTTTLLGNGDGSFRSAGTYALTTGGDYLGNIADLNSDGIYEAIFLQQSIGEVVIASQSTTKTTKIGGMDITSIEAAREQLNETRATLERVTAEIGALGAYESRLKVAMNALNSGAINSIAAESRIRDVDFAQESSRLISVRILQDIGASVLAQSNVQPNLALQLLRDLER